MSKDFDIHEWRLYQANLNLLNEEEKDWKFTAGPEWNEKELKVGSIITPDMWEANKISDSEYDVLLKFQNKLEEYTKIGGDWYVLLIDSSNKRMYWEVNMLNDWLKPGYEIIIPDNMNEQDKDEFNQEFIAGPEWNVKELGIGDVVTPEMWDQDKIENISISIIRDKGWFKRPHKITRFRQTYLDFVIFDENKELSLYFVKDFLKPNFKINFSGLNEQDEDEWKFTAGDEWNEFDGTVVITYVLEDVGYTYIDDDDVEEFDRLNPGVLDKFDYNELPIRETIVQKSKPVYIKDLISDLEEVERIQAQPYIGEKTTQGFKDWMADNGIDIESLPYLYDTLNPTIIKTIHSYGKGDPVKITKKMEDRMDYNDDTFYGEVIDVKFNDKLTESDDENFDWNLTAGHEWNEKILKIGDKLTPEMFKDNTTGKHWSTVLDLTIKKIDRKHGKLTYIAKYPDGDKNTGQWDLKWTERELNPGFGFDLPLNEQDNDWDFKAGKEWNEKEIKVGDYWKDSINPEWSGVWSNYYDIPESMTDLVLNVIYIGPYKEEFSKPPYNIPNYYGDNVIISKRNGNFWAFTVNYFNESFGPKLNAYIPTDNLNELDDDFEDWVVAGPEWNETLLSTGDKITPEMWNEKAVIDAGEEDEFLEGETWTIIEIDNTWISIKSNGGGFLSWDIDSVQALLKPQYKIVVKKDLFEEDEWDLKAGPEWNVTELGIGDTITSNMWNKNLSPEYGNIGDWIDNPAENQTIDWIDIDDNGVVGIWFTGKKSNIQNIYTLEDFNNLLDPKYRVILPLTESENKEWDLKAGPEWGVQELTTGDIITPDMWNNDFPDEWYDEFQGWELEIDDFQAGNEVVVLIGSGVYYVDLEEFNSYLEPKYQIVPPLYEQDKDEFSQEIIASDEWNIHELTTGDYITPDMWDWQSIGAFIERMNDDDHEGYRNDWQEWKEGTKNPIKILKIHGHGESTYPELDGYLFRWGPNIRFINTMLKPEFKVIST